MYEFFVVLIRINFILTPHGSILRGGTGLRKRDGNEASRRVGGVGGAFGGVILGSPGNRHTNNSTVFEVVRSTSSASCWINYYDLKF